MVLCSGYGKTQCYGNGHCHVRQALKDDLLLEQDDPSRRSAKYTIYFLEVLLTEISKACRQSNNDNNNKETSTAPILHMEWKRRGIALNIFSVVCLYIQLLLCCSSLISVLLVLSTVYLFVKVSFSPDIIPSG